MEILAALLAVLVLCWAAVCWLPRKARPGPEAGAARAFGGLQLFGKSGAYVELWHQESKGRLRFERLQEGNGRTSLRLRFISMTPSREHLRRFSEQAAIAGVLVESLGETEGGLVLLGELGAVNRAAWEAVARLAAEASGWSWSDRYRVEFAGPKDYARVDEFFGFKSRRRR